MTNLKKLQNWAESQNVENLDLSYYIDEFIYDFDDLRESLENQNAFEVEIIYYCNAIEYLSENDPSLTESLELANDMGYNPNDLNSEILATLHASNKVREDFAELENSFNEFIEELETETETE